MESSKKWLWIRLAVVGVGALSGPSSLWGMSESDIDWGTCLIVFSFCTLGMVFVIGIQAANPLSAPRWRKPRWTINPFLFKEPLQFFHLAAFHFLAAGLSACAAIPFIGWKAAPYAVFFLAMGGGAWAGVSLSMVLFRKKMVDE